METKQELGSQNWQLSFETWVKHTLTQQQFVLLDKFEQVSGWSLGYVFKQPTIHEDLYCKATAFLPLFTNEAKLCQTLFQLFPDSVPEVISACEAQQWMILKDFGGSLPQDSELSVWQGAFHQFAALQVRASSEVKRLQQAGCLTREISQLSSALGALLNDANIVTRLPSKVVENKVAIIEKLEEHIAQLNQYRLPSTLVHGDLHIENIASTAKGFLYFDWSDACISHPFIDGTYIYRMPDSEAKQHIVDAYLAQWSKFASREALIKAWQLAELVCYAHQAVSYGSMINYLPQTGIAAIEQAFLNAYQRLLICLTE